MGNKTQVKQEGGTRTGWSQTGYRYGKSNAPKKPSFNSNITEIKGTVFDQGRSPDAAKYEYPI